MEEICKDKSEEINSLVFCYFRSAIPGVLLMRVYFKITGSLFAEIST